VLLLTQWGAQATDLAHEQCVRARAAYVLASCCVGKLAASTTLAYPRSASFRRTLRDRDHYLALAAAADVSSSHTASGAERARRLCKSLVEVGCIG
jgi:hypothetical protein